MLPEEDVQEQPAARPAPARQSSRDAAPQRGSRSVVPPAGAGAPETHSRSSRKVTQRVSRANAPVPQPIPRKYLIGAGAGVVLLLAAVIGWNPFWRWSYGSTLKNSSASVDARKAAAGRLVQNYLKDSLYYFDGVSETSDPGRREASAYGLELLGTARNFGTQPIEHLAGALPKNDEPGKVLLIQTIDRIMRDLARNKPPSDEESKCDAERARKAAAALISETEPAVPQAARAEAVKALRELRVPGVCLQMLKLARTEKGELRDLARNGVNSTALPDAVGGLLKAMADAGDPELAQAARSAFVVVRESAKSTELTPLVSDPAPGVRREIISALGSRGGDLEAARGITLALGDALPELRILALKAVPKTGLNPASRMTQLLGALVTDASEGVRIQNAETLGELRDDDSKKVILSAFGKNLEGATLAAYIKALGKRSYGKDIQAVAFLMPLLDSQPQAEKCIRDALVRLTLNNVPGREAVRSQWSAQRWKEWYDKIVKREKVRSGALAALAKCDTQRHADKSEYPRLGRETNKALEELEDCMTNRCDPDDSEDKPLIEAEMFKYGMMKSLFMKSQALEGTH